ncbi:hypothetical protein ACSYAY_10840 [Leptospirillum ferriphilum]|uniref:hypothetical protein n=1 Tax=Leptospirillum ferriphilum TaxID=178606 RepID=UPI003EE7D8C8|nr:hypothetical protein [Nitrospirota bacterium]
MKSEKTSKKPKGIVRRLDPESKPNARDVIFAPDYTVTSTTDNGGQVLTDIEVLLCFWGSFWSKTPAPSPSSDDYKTAIEGILTGPFMGGLRQYRGVAQGTLIYSEINDSTDPADGYTDTDVVNMLTDRLKNTAMPPPLAGHNRFYAVIVPPGINNSITQYAGQHQSFSYNGVTGYYAWVDNTGSLTGHNCVTKVFSHELVEACTDPNGDSILVDGTQSNGTAVTNDEIGDTCNNQFATADMNGVQCSVQSYWSEADNACILPLGTLAFWVDKDTFGKDEVQDVINTSGGKWEKAFWLVVEGFSRDTFNALQVTIPAPTGPFANLTGVNITQNGIDYENADPSVQQRIRIAFDITFNRSSLASFPSSGYQTYELDAFLATNGNKVAGTDASTQFELVAGADPYFQNIDPNLPQSFSYLSQDLRVFTATPGKNNVPIAGAPPFASDSTDGAYSYIQSLLTWLNDPKNHFMDGTKDPFASGVIPQPSDALTGDSSVTPLTVDISGFPLNIAIYKNYNFALARVRLRGAADTANGVRVFFRLWSTETADTDYQPGSTYPSTLDAAGYPESPLVGTGHHTLPFFASQKQTDYSTGGANIHDLQIPTGQDSLWTYYGCFLNLYDPNNMVDGKPVQEWLNGTHHCIVAEIAYDDAPIYPGASTESSDKLAQRNLQVTLSDNPGPAATHRIPQTFDIRPSMSGNPSVDELMIDWGAIPSGSIASIYWPQVPASDVLALASELYSSNTLSAADTHTVQCKITGGVTYVPIPPGTGENFAGLFTVDLPATVVTGQEFNIVVRRIAARHIRDINVPTLSLPSTTTIVAATEEPVQHRSWRYVIGTFQVKIPVATKEVMLFPEENTLAILKWRLQQMSPSNRWYPVLERYIGYISDRVDGLGGNASSILPSPEGAPPEQIVEVPGHEYTGKVCDIFFDCFGDFEGFVLRDCCGTHTFRTRERGIEELVLRACKERLLLSVCVEGLPDEHRICKLVIRC